MADSSSEMKMDVMIDIEAMSTRSNAALASIGAVAFNRHEVTPIEELVKSSFYVNVDLRQQGWRHFDGSTIYWWLSQSNQARESIQGDLQLPDQALQLFTDWYNRVRGGRAWAYGATYDHVILESLYQDRRLPNPISYRDQLCMRTVVKLAKVERPAFSGVAHNALDDALVQTHWLQLCFDKLRSKQTLH